MVKAFEVLFHPEENHSWLDWGGNSFTPSNLIPQNHHSDLAQTGDGLHSVFSLRLCCVDITDIIPIN